LAPQSESSFRRKPESRVPGENRDPVFELVPDFRRDDVWTPAFAGVTLQGTFCEIIKVGKKDIFQAITTSTLFILIKQDERPNKKS